MDLTWTFFISLEPRLLIWSILSHIPSKVSIGLRGIRLSESDVELSTHGDHDEYFKIMFNENPLNTFQ